MANDLLEYKAGDREFLAGLNQLMEQPYPKQESQAQPAEQPIVTSCNFFVNHIHWYDGRGTPEQQRNVMIHLGWCADCTIACDQLRPHD